jgi:hypothetical protein
MEISSVGYGSYPEILPLNSNFKPDDRFLKIVLEVHKQDVEFLGDFKEAYQRLTLLFPNIKRHQCCHDSLYADRIRTRGGVPLKEADIYANIAHLTEHLIIDLIASISGLRSVSGITCGYLKPINRHDIFVECPRKPLGLFAANLALEVMENLNNGTVQKNRVKRLTKLAKIIENDCRKRFTAKEIADRICCSRDEARHLLNDYRRLSKVRGE